VRASCSAVGCKRSTGILNKYSSKNIKIYSRITANEEKFSLETRSKDEYEQVLFIARVIILFPTKVTMAWVFVNPEATAALHSAVQFGAFWRDVLRPWLTDQLQLT